MAESTKQTLDATSWMKPNEIVQRPGRGQPDLETQNPDAVPVNFVATIPVKPTKLMQRLEHGHYQGETQTCSAAPFTLTAKETMKPTVGLQRIWRGHGVVEIQFWSAASRISAIRLVKSTIFMQRSGAANLRLKAIVVVPRSQVLAAKMSLKSRRPMQPRKGEANMVSPVKKEARKVYSLHRTFDQGLEGAREQVLYVSEGKEVERLVDAKLLKFLKSLRAGDTIRLTQVSGTDAMLLDFEERGIRMLYVYWHAAGIAKGLPPEEIVAAVAELPESVFREYHPRPDIAELRHWVSLRNATVKFYGNALRAVKQEGWNLGLVTEEELWADPRFAQTMLNLDEIRKSVVCEEHTQLDTKIGKLAAKIHECVIVQKVCCVQEWISAAAVVSYSGGFDRFPGVAHLWSYAGDSVKDGAAPKRKPGSVVRWSPKLRTALYMLGTSIIKNRDNPWRAYYDRELERELAAHDQKHPGCKTKQGHCGARARRKMVKEILKRIWLAAHGEKYEHNHVCDEIQKVVVMPVLQEQQAVEARPSCR